MMDRGGTWVEVDRGGSDNKIDVEYGFEFGNGCLRGEDIILL